GGARPDAAGGAGQGDGTSDAGDAAVAPGGAGARARRRGGGGGDAARAARRRAGRGRGAARARCAAGRRGAVGRSRRHPPAAHADADAAPMLVEQQALVFTRLLKPDRAEAAWRRLHALRPESPDPLQALARRFRADQRWDELADVMGQLVELLREPAEVRRAAVELARLETETLERPARAIAAWQRVLAMDPDADEALAALALLYARADRNVERRQVLDRRAERALGAAQHEATAIAAEAAEAAMAAGDDAAAAAWYRRVIEREPLHGAAQAYLEDALRGRAAWAELVALLQ